jgi:hypothetical protein
MSLPDNETKGKFHIIGSHITAVTGRLVRASHHVESGIKLGYSKTKYKAGEIGKKIKGGIPFSQNDPKAGAQALYDYLMTHENIFRDNVGAHFFIAMYEQDPSLELLYGFLGKFGEFGYHLKLDEDEQKCLERARDETHPATRMGDLIAPKQMIHSVMNRRKALTLFGLGAVAGGTALVVGLSDVFLIARSYVGQFMNDTFGVDLSKIDPIEARNYQAEASRLIRLSMVDGKINEELLRNNLADFLESRDERQAIRQGRNRERALVGVLSGVSVIIMGRATMLLMTESFKETRHKREEFVTMLDGFCNYKLGRTPFPPEEARATARGR